MKRLIALTALALFTMPAFAQIDDVVNKPKERTQRSDAPSIFSSLLNIVSSVEVTNLMDQVRKDGTKESKYYAVLGVSGQILKVHGPDQYTTSEKNLRVLPFTLRLAADDSLYLVTSVASIDNLFEATVGSDEIIPVKKVDFLSFKIDRNMTFRDIKTIGWSLVNVDLTIPVIGYSKTRYLAFELGGELGFDQETITLNDGEVVSIGPGKDIGAVNGDYECMSNNCKTGNRFVVRAGLEIREEIGKRGYLTLGAKAEYSTLRGGMKTTGVDYVRESLIIKPSVSYTTPISQSGKTKLTFGVDANFQAIQKLKGYQGGYEKPQSRDIDLKDRFRQPYQAKVILTF